MSLSLSWIDPADWERLLTAAGLDPRPPAFAPAPATVRVIPQAEPSVVPVPAPLAAPAAAALPREPAGPAAPDLAGASTAPAAPAAEAAPFEPPAGRIEARLAAFVAWAQRETGAEHVVVADEEGLPLAASDDTTDAAALAAELLRVVEVVRRSSGRPDTGTIDVSLDAERSLQVVETIAAGGRYGLGIVGRSGPGQERSRRIAEELRRAFEG